MLSPCQLEELENLRRIAERGKSTSKNPPDTTNDELARQFTDVFVRILDGLERRNRSRSAACVYASERELSA